MSRFSCANHIHSAQRLDCQCWQNNHATWQIILMIRIESDNLVAEQDSAMGQAWEKFINSIVQTMTNWRIMVIFKRHYACLCLNCIEIKTREFLWTEQVGTWCRVAKHKMFTVKWTDSCLNSGIHDCRTRSFLSTFSGESVTPPSTHFATWPKITLAVSATSLPNVQL